MTQQLLPPRYTSVEAVARGGMGEIYKARDDLLDRVVAVKVLAEHYARDPALRARFMREAHAAARLSNDPNSITIYDVGEWDGRPYIVMELVTGGTIADRRTGRGHDPDETLRWLEQAGTALDAAHARGVVHRDVKPANLLLTGEGDVRVADFGIASATGLSSLTETGTVLGTVGYLAPEQAIGGEAGPAADRYALAVVGYELLAGRRPFQHATGPAEALAAGREPVPPISDHGLPPALDRVFVRALARDPRERYASCAEFVADLRSALAPPAPAPTAVTTEPTRVSPPVRHRTPRRVPWLAWALVLAALAGVGVAAAVLLTRDGGEERATPTGETVRTVTAEGSTVTVTTQAATTAPATTAASTPPPPPSSASGSALNDEGYSAMQAGDYRRALPLLLQAVKRLEGSASLTEAYALYNLAFTRFSLGDCDGVLDMLARSQAIQGHRSEIDSLRQQATPRC